MPRVPELREHERLQLTPPTLAGVADATPADRDRWVDFLRGVSILTVVVGHWTVSVVLRAPDGHLTGTSALAAAPWLRWATWVFQVMPVFFFVGGFSNQLGLRHDPPYGAYLGRRLARLLRPALVFALVWVPLAAVLDASALDERSVRLAAKLAAQPLWFLAVYVGVVAAAPGMLRLHRRWPRGVLVVLGAGVVALDAARFHEVAAGAAWANYALVFVFVHQLGFHYGDGAHERLGRRMLALGGLGALVVLAALVTVGPYPASMVGVPGEDVSNMSPPTVCIVVLGLAQVALLLAVRPPVERWLQRRRVWMATVVVNLRIMTVFLWHLTALALVAVAADNAGVDFPAGGTAGWWWSRPLWWIAATAILSVFVILARRAEVAAGATRPSAVRALAAAVLGVAAFAGLALGGFAEPLAASSRGLGLAPAVNVALLALAAGLVGALDGRAASDNA